MTDPLRSSEIERNTRVFISYSGKDLQFADNLNEAREAGDFDSVIHRTATPASKNCPSKTMATL
jgi:hypothetical protein